MYIFTYYT